MRFAIATAVQGRYKLYDLFCEYYAEMKRVLDFDLFVSVSEDQTRIITNRWGHTPLMVPNQPLWQKVNASAQASRNYDFTIFIGSDDFMTEQTLRYYIALFEQNKYEYVYPLDWYFFDTRTKRGLYWAGYNKEFNRGIACGAGRAFSKRAMGRMNYQPWIKGFDHVLDSGMDKQIRKLRLKSFGFKLKDMNLFAMDVKTANNMTPFAVWDNSFLIEGKRMLKEFLPNHVNKFYNLTPH
jgi:hypothetical protein